MNRFNAERYSRVLLTALAALLASSMPANGQVSDAAEAIWREVDQTLAHQAMTRVGDTYFGTLPAGESETIEIRRLRGLPFRLVGFCDSDCSDLDLVIMDPDGTEIDTDLAVDAAPVVEVGKEAADRSESFMSTYQARVQMVTCSVEPCMWTAQSYMDLPTWRSTGDPIGLLWEDARDGELGEGDDRLEGGEFFDSYEYEASPSPGRALTVSVESIEFDTYVIIRSPSGEVFQNDDFEGSQNRSQLRVPVSELGTWRVVVTSFEGGESGTYKLSVELGIPMPGAPSPIPE